MPALTEDAALRAIERSAREERESIVEWLRGGGNHANAIADTIERGDHRDRRA